MNYSKTGRLQRITSSAGITVSYDVLGSGPPLVLVHGAFSDHHSNWDFVMTPLAQEFTVYALARRGRGETTRTAGHSVEDEASDVIALINIIDGPVHLLGHSHGAMVALVAAAQIPARVQKLALYEAPRRAAFGRDLMTRLETLAQNGRWDDFAVTFFRDGLLVPAEDLDELRTTAHWPPIVDDAPATVGDLRAMQKYDFAPARFRGLSMPVLLQVGTESPNHLYVTDDLAAVLPNARIEALPGQAHEGMTTAPEMYRASVSRFLLS